MANGLRGWSRRRILPSFLEANHACSALSRWPLGLDAASRFLAGYWIALGRRVMVHAFAGRCACRAKFSDHPFQLGVASGDPLPDGVVLWTRLAPKPLEGGGMPEEAVQVDWQVADDEQMTKVVKKGTTVANPDWAHSVHVEVQGLRPDRWYFYQFRAGGETSPVGRTRTTPAAETMPERLRFAFASCQHFERATTPPTNTCSASIPTW